MPNYRNMGRGFYPDIKKLNISRGETPVLESGAYAYVQGRMFEKWIDDNSRANGYNVNGLIENPAYIGESFFRDEIYVEREMVGFNLTPICRILKVSFLF